MSRRGNGEGTIYYNKARARWEGQLDLGRDGEGRRIRRKATGKSKTAVSSKLQDIRERELHVRPSEDIRTLSDLLSHWLETAAAARLQHSTLVGYGHHVAAINRRLGKVRLDHLSPEDVDRYLLNQAQAGYSRATLVRHRSVLGQAVRWGIRRRHIAWDVVAVAEMPPPDVFEAAAPNGAERRTPRSLDKSQFRRFATVARTRRNGAALLIAGTLGLRPGEVTALLWEDVELEENVLHVRRAWKDAGSSRVLGPPKTGGSSRSVRMPNLLVEQVRTHRRQQLELRMSAADWSVHDPGLVFTSRSGTPIDPANFRRLVREVADEADVGHLTPYDLRHTATSLLSDSGVRNELLADLLGHRDTRMVEHHYRHRLAESVDVAAAPMDALLS